MLKESVQYQIPNSKLSPMWQALISVQIKMEREIIENQRLCELDTTTTIQTQQLVGRCVELQDSPSTSKTPSK